MTDELRRWKGLVIRDHEKAVWRHRLKIISMVVLLGLWCCAIAWCVWFIYLN